MQTSLSSARDGVSAPSDRWTEPLLFAGRALASPRRIGALLPSSQELAQTMARLVRGPAIVELGPGSGRITRHILRDLGPAGRLLALELDAGMAAHLSRHLGEDPRLTLRVGDASQLPDWLSELAWGGADSVVSGIPFQALPPSARELILAGASRALVPGGRFIAYQYGLRLLPVFRRHFRRVRVLGPVWRNLPPAYVLLAQP